MEKPNVFRPSEKKNKEDKTLSIIMAIVGTLFWVPICWFISTPSNSNWRLVWFTVSFGVAAWGVGRFLEIILNQNVKLVIDKTGISETGHHLSQNDWQVAWNEVREVSYSTNQQSILIYSSHSIYSDNYKTHQIYGYDDLDYIYKATFYHREKLIKEQRDELAEEEHIRQQQERRYFQQLKRLEEIQKIDPIAFEKLIFSLFNKMGYSVKLTQASRDEGIDLILSKDGKKSIVQCKRYSGTVGQPTVRDLYGSMLHNHAEDAYLITTGVISLPAQKWASGKPIHLVDGKVLIEWIEEISEAG